MRRLVEFQLPDGGGVFVEVEDGGVGEAGTRGWGDRGAQTVEQAQHGFETAVEKVRPAVQVLFQQLRSLAEAPDEVQVEFGLQLSAEVGAFVAGASTSGNFKVSMTWRQRPDRGSQHSDSVRSDQAG